MLAFGTARAIATDASVTAINILLEPNAKLLQQAAASKERMCKTFLKTPSMSGPTLSSGTPALAVGSAAVTMKRLSPFLSSLPKWCALGESLAPAYRIPALNQHRSDADGIRA